MTTDPAIYHARRALRSSVGVEAYMRTSKPKGEAFCRARVMRYVEILPPLLTAHCVAEAERLAYQIIINERKES